MVCRWQFRGLHTKVLGRGGNLAEELDKVGQVIAEELGLEDQVLAAVEGGELSSQELGLADNAQSRPSVSVLQFSLGSAELPIASLVDRAAYPECIVLQSLGQAGQRLVSGTGLGHQGEGGGRSSIVSARKLDAVGLAGLVLKGA